MAQRAFEWDHQRPPQSADELVPAYLPQRPVVVSSGEDMWTISQRPREPILSAAMTPDVSSSNAQDVPPRVPPPRNVHDEMLLLSGLDLLYLRVCVCVCFFKSLSMQVWRLLA